MIRPGYFVRQALRGMRAKPMIQLAAVGAIAVGLLLVGVAVVCALNVERLANHWGRGTQLTVYLKQDATRARAFASRATVAGAFLTGGLPRRASAETAAWRRRVLVE